MFCIYTEYKLFLVLDLLAYLRLKSCQGWDAFHLEALFRDVAWSHFMEPLSKENEDNVCKSMIDGVKEALAAYCECFYITV